MPSISNIVAAMAFTAGIAQAIPSTRTKNASSSAGASKTSSAAGMATLPALAESAYCPGLNGALVGDYLIECSTTHFGTILQVGNGTVAVAKRAVYTSLGDCINLCSTTSTCVGTAFDTAARTCTLYSEVGQAVAANGVDFAVLTNPTGNSVGAGDVATSTIFSTQLVTISSCAPTVTNCPLKNGASVVTQVVAVSSTEYICPTATTLPASAYAPSSGSMVPVQTVVVNSPCAQATANMNNGNGNNNSGNNSGAVTSTVTVCNSGKCSAVATTIAVASATTSQMAVYTGAADSVKAGSAFAAFVAGAAILL
ncbi:unnamed protein product [Aureobasidium vineae]|uniref:Apple domain-containing protein n=1 Tax=Aureobasidium vineae TaxID=2773715 RepID=A0A9N8JXY4_9PEZI|nr:unnamed protein product [Aureobasidium vineae]